MGPFLSGVTQVGDQVKTVLLHLLRIRPKIHVADRLGRDAGQGVQTDRGAGGLPDPGPQPYADTASPQSGDRAEVAGELNAGRDTFRGDRVAEG